MASISTQLVIEVENPSPHQTGFDPSSLLAPLLAATIVVVGWLVIEKFARRREIRNDLREAANGFRDAVDETTVTAISFYKLPGNAPQAAAIANTLKLKIKGLSEYIEMLRGSGVDLRTDDQLKEYRQAVTGDDFESLSRTAQAAESPRFKKVSLAGEELARTVQQQVLRHLLPSPRRRRKQRRPRTP